MSMRQRHYTAIPLRQCSYRRAGLSIAAGLALAAPHALLAQQTLETGTESTKREITLGEVRVLGTAEEQVKQGLGTSVISRQDLDQRPPANDLSEIIRTQPGVNLTGASSNGNYGNQRQIDIRGMGPENTLIMIDGKPVLSRNGAVMKVSGERDTHGDSNWVPVDAVEKIEVIRGPAAARYGSGAAGGVVNIITKKATDRMTGSLSTYYGKAQSGDDGATKRSTFNFSGPLSDKLSFRLYGSVAKTDADGKTSGSSEAAGREGTRNRDVDGTVKWQLTPDQSLEFQAGFSRQGNIYAGNNGTGNAGTGLNAYYGSEIRRTYRQSASVVHRAKWGNIGDSRVTLQYENTRTVNCNKGLVGNTYDNCFGAASRSADSEVESTGFNTSHYKTYLANGELNTPLKIGGLDQVLTSGIEFRREQLNDPNAVTSYSQTVGAVENYSQYQKTHQSNLAAYLEDNIEVARGMILTPGVRFDYYDEYGANWSPSLNASYEINSEFTVKGGIARVFKAPNLYQVNPGYAWYSSGNGCGGYGGSGTSSGCYILGNPDLKPEISVNKEIGVAWDNHNGWDSSLSYFRNDYKNKITSAVDSTTTTNSSGYVTAYWENAGKALIHGLEGSFNVPLLGESGSRLKWLNNATWMFSNKDEDGQTLSVIPKYTINSTLDWRVSAAWRTQLTATFYGRQKPRTLGRNNTTVTGDALTEVGAYTLVGVNATYTINKNYRVGFGITNLLDKTIERQGTSSSSNGAATYTEPGRAYFATLTASF